MMDTFCGPERVYVVRVNGRQNTKKALCERHTITNPHDINSRRDYYELTQRGHEVAVEVAAYMQECIENMKQGIMPSPENSSQPPRPRISH